MSHPTFPISQLLFFYEAALSAKVALPGEAEERGGMRKKLKYKARQAAKALRPKGKNVPLPQGERVSEIVMVGGATHMVAVRKLVANLFEVFFSHSTHFSHMSEPILPVSHLEILCF